jgi:hypothetical protein
LIVFGIIVFIYGLIWLKFFNNTETRIEDNVVTRFSVPTEYQNKDSFWWLLEGENVISILNFSTERQNGNLILSTVNNPCKNIESVIFQNQEYKFNNDEKVEISTKFIIEPLQTIYLNLFVKNEDKCIIQNGDQRNFGVKVIDWVIE